MKGCISFVGAGPGDPDLITVKGLRRLRAAGVVVHDHLVASELLDEARADAEIIDVGKAPGGRSLPQAEINCLLVSKAADRPVVRLKGGDPGVFGRLAEEIRAVTAAGIPFEVVPGVSAGLAAAARLGISLTERGAASAVTLATGTDLTGEVPESFDWAALAAPGTTLVFYMAVRTLETVTARLIESGRDPFEAAAIVERAATRDERIVRAPLGTIAAAARDRAIASPAILVVGPTVDAARAGADALTAAVEA